MTGRFEGKGSESALRVVVLRPAREALEREVEGRREETGGMILGRWSTGRETLVVTDFTGPGPNAVHRVGHFSADAGYQQTVLDGAVQRWGTGYVGEWHLHPGMLSRPSEWDRQQARALLEDPERPLASVVLAIVNQDARDGVRIFPYLARLDRGLLVIEPLAWDEVGLRLGGEPRRQAGAGPGPEADPPPDLKTEVAGVAEEPAKPDGPGLAKRLVKVVGSALTWLTSGLGDRGEKTPGALSPGNSQAAEPGGVASGSQAGAADEVGARVRTVVRVGDPQPLPWYRNGAGRQRLADEKRRLDRAGLSHRVVLLRGGEIGFRFAEKGGGELVVVCRDGFPRTGPRVIRRGGGGDGRWEWVRPADTEPWREDLHLADVVEGVLRSRCG